MTIKYEFSKIAEANGYMSEHEMWKDLSQYKLPIIQEKFQKYISNISRSTISKYLRLAGFQTHGKGGWHGTEAYLYRRKKPSKINGKVRYCQYPGCQHKNKRLPEGRYFMHADCMKKAERFNTDTELYGVIDF